MIGIDEVGRGAWAGPLLVCAVRLKYPIYDLKDSKLLSPKRRQSLSGIILADAEVGYGWISAKLIDDIGLSAALRLACKIAAEEILPQEDELIIIDGNVNYLPGLNVNTIPKADQIVPCVSAASIVAKVARDSYMQKLAPKYPHYGFENHVGYGTASHKRAIETFGYTIEHRLSFKLPVKQLHKAL